MSFCFCHTNSLPQETSSSHYSPLMQVSHMTNHHLFLDNPIESWTKSSLPTNGFSLQGRDRDNFDKRNDTPEPHNTGHATFRNPHTNRWERNYLSHLYPMYRV